MELCGGKVLDSYYKSKLTNIKKFRENFKGLKLVIFLVKMIELRFSSKLTTNVAISRKNSRF